VARFGFICVPHTVSLAVEMARASEEGGLWGLGIGDSQARYMELYSVATACLGATEHLTVGAIVTNPVTRHWTVHAAAARALDELAPGRFVLGLGAGNSSVRSIGAAPARPDVLASSLTNIRAACPPAVRILVATDAPRLAGVAGQLADGLIIGTGLDATAIAEVRGLAEAARADGGLDEPLEPWLSVPLIAVEDDGDLAAAEARAVGVAVSMARRSLSGDLERKNVPLSFRAVLHERLERYDMRHHGSTSTTNPNDMLFTDTPELEAYLVDRFTIVGTADTCRRRVETVISETGIENFWFSSLVPDPVQNIRLAAAGFAPLLAAHAR
jgi:alkanesulfonate monooxygenase SsuD/methylene tetrahydromethanopterin reductase-like flavin-dependent oxidoreductase (luciferase family)